MRRDNGIILGEDLTLNTDTRVTGLNNNVLVVGSTGFHKTRGVVMPNLAQMNSSYIITDPKGDLLKQFGNLFLENGYKVKVLDMINGKNSMHYNPFLYFRNNTDLEKLAHNIAHTVKSERDPYWHIAGEKMIKAALAYVNYFEENKSLAHVSYLVNGGVNNSRLAEARKRAVAEMAFKEEVSFESFENEKYVMRCIDEAMTVSGVSTTNSCIISTAINALHPYSNETAREINNGEDEMNLHDIPEEKTALFVTLSDTDSTMYSFANLFFTQCFDTLFDDARKYPGNTLPYPVTFVMDDFFSICDIPDFPRIISNCRSRNIRMMIIAQNEAQIEARYAKEASTVISNCATYIFTGCNDLEMALRISRRTNLPADEILSMPQSKQWVFVSGRQPYYINKFDIRKHPNYRRINDSNRYFDNAAFLNQIRGKVTEMVR